MCASATGVNGAWNNRYPFCNKNSLIEPVPYIRTPGVKNGQCIEKLRQIQIQIANHTRTNTAEIFKELYIVQIVGGSKVQILIIYIYEQNR